MALYFDFSAMDRGGQYRSLQAAQTFIRTQMTSTDSLSILRITNGSVDVLQDFTADRNRLLSIVETMVVGETRNGLPGRVTPAPSIQAQHLDRTIVNSTYSTPIGSLPL